MRPNARCLVVLGLAFIFNPTTAAASPESLTEENLPCTSVADELNFTNYWLGPSFEGLELTWVERFCGAGGRNNSISYWYGDCTPRGGGCPAPLELQVYPSSQRNREMYAANPPGFEIRSEDRTVNGVPATSYQGHFEVYYPDTTVVVFGDAAPKGYVAKFLVEAPSRLIDLEEHGLFFDGSCARDIRGCSADRNRLNEGTEFLLRTIGWIALYFGLPFLAALFIGRPWVLLIPVGEWALLFVAASMGWIGIGENWQFGFGLGALASIVLTGLGLLLRRLVMTAIRSRRERASETPVSP